MPVRRRRAVYGRRRRKKALKRKRPMEFNQLCQLACPHEGDLDIKNEINLEPAMKRILLWCYGKLPNIRSYITSAFCAISPSRALQSQLSATQVQLEAVKQELRIISQKLDDFESKMKESSNQPNQNISVKPIPVPPPPPPPPPVLQAKPPLVFRKSTSSTERKEKKNEPHLKQTLCVSLGDILNVKLKKRVDSSVDRNKENQIPGKQPRITLSEITSVTLKSSEESCGLNLNTEQPRTPPSFLLKRKLRGTGIKRSPGGTPIVKRDPTLSSATGPTPDIERALRRKFRSLRTSPLAEHNATSP